MSGNGKGEFLAVPLSPGEKPSSCTFHEPFEIEREPRIFYQLLCSHHALVCRYPFIRCNGSSINRVVPDARGPRRCLYAMQVGSPCEHLILNESLMNLQSRAWDDQNGVQKCAWIAQFPSWQLFCLPQNSSYWNMVPFETVQEHSCWILLLGQSQMHQHLLTMTLNSLWKTHQILTNM